jgi:hypothetical protein
LKMRELACTALILAFSTLCFHEVSAAQSNAAPLGTINLGYFQAEVKLAASLPTVCHGEAFDLEFILRCTGGSAATYNGLLISHLRMPVKICFVSEDGAVRRELSISSSADAVAGNQNNAGEDASDWIRLRSSQGIGRRITVVVRHENSDVPEDQPAEGVSVDLPPGKYKIQAICSKWLLPGSREQGEGDAVVFATEPDPLPGMTFEQMEAKLGESNVVELDVLAKRSSSIAAKRAIAAKGNAACPIRVSVDPVELRAQEGQRFAVTISIANVSKQDITVFNPMLDPLLWNWRTISLDAVDREGRTVCNLLARSSGSSRRPNEADWIALPPGGFILSEHRFPVNRIIKAGRMGVESSDSFGLIAQVHANSLVDCPLRSDDTNEGMKLAEWRTGFPGKVVARSRTVPLLIQSSTRP